MGHDPPLLPARGTRPKPPLRAKSGASQHLPQHHPNNDTFGPAPRSSQNRRNRRKYLN